MHSNKAWRLGILTTALALTAALTGCEKTTISEINKHPQRYVGTEVTIAGKVTSTVASHNSGTFQVDDGTGRLWVLSMSNDVPAQDSRLVVTGLVESGINLGSSSLATTLQEITRHKAE